MVSNGLDLGIYLKFVHSNWCHNVHDFFAAVFYLKPEQPVKLNYHR